MRYETSGQLAAWMVAGLMLVRLKYAERLGSLMALLSGAVPISVQVLAWSIARGVWQLRSAEVVRLVTVVTVVDELFPGVGSAVAELTVAVFEDRKSVV